MKKLIYYELRKLCGQVSILSVILLILLSTTFNLIFYIGYKNKSILDNGSIISGISSFRKLKTESKKIEGIVNQDYLNKLVEMYNSDKDKSKFNKDLGNYESKYRVSNYLINFAKYKSRLTNFTIDLNYDFIKSENNFYNQYKEAISDTVKSNNKLNWFKYTDTQLHKIDKKIDNLNTPFKVEYYLGLGNFIYQYGQQYWLVLITITFVLGSIFSKDSYNGIDELILSSTCGRKQSMNAKILAGNIFASIIYMLFIVCNLIVHGLVASLHGWGQSAQNFWHTCFYNINLGIGILIMLSFGLFSTLIVSNFIMMISIKIKYSKVSTLLSLGCVYYLINLTKTSNPKQLQFNPIYFSTRLTASNIVDFDFYYFIGKFMLPYSIIAIFIGCIYLLIIRLITIVSYKKYNLD